mmetsp:Transcript_63511/g.105937  ORF Transcript_63511/g.105937 Transcript_63511/m.105937 type:complete len:411 (+) Transcript_63511:505-1737(+)
MHEGTLGVHQVELVVNAGEHLSDGSAVADHADSTLHLGQITTRHNSGWLVVDTALETSGAPVHELDGTLGLDGGHRGVHVLGDNITTVHQAAGHVLSVTWVTLGHHRGGLESGVGDLSNGELLMVGLLGGDDRGPRRQHEVDTWVWHQVGLELSHVDVQGTIEPQGGGQRGDNLAQQSVQVGVGWSLNVQVAAADVINSLVVEHDSDIGVLQQRVGGQHTVVWLHDGGGHLRGWVDGEAELGLLAVVNGQTLQQKSTQAGSGTTSDGVEAQEALETSAVVSKLTDTVQAEVDDLLTDGVVTTGVVVGGILLAADQLLRVEQLAVGTSTNLVNHSGLQVQEDTPRHVLASTSLGEEGVEGIVLNTDGLVRWHRAIRLDTVLQAVQLPAGVTNLDTSLAKVDRDNFTHFEGK